MMLPPFGLDHWLERFKLSSVTHDLASSTGGVWTLGDLLGMLDPEERAALDRLPMTYGSAPGSGPLREAIGAHLAVDPEDVVVTTGASEAFHILFAGLAIGDQVLVPSPCYPPLLEMPRALGLDVRTYGLRPERRLALDLDEIARLIGPRTRMLLVNSPHNPTGAVVDARTWTDLAALARERGVTLVSDEVYWPIAFDQVAPSATVFPEAIVVGGLSKAISLSGLRLGWIVDRNHTRREKHLNTRMYFTISNSPLGEALATLALRRAERFVSRTAQRALAGRNHLLTVLARNADLVGVVPPAGGTVAWPWLTFAEDSRPFCEALAGEGVLVAPGDCFGEPRHFRVGFAAAPRIEEALAIFERVLRQQASAVLPGKRSVAGAIQ